MHVQIVEFHLRDMSEAEYRATCEQLAPAFAEIPGLDAKIWLADATTGTYGGVYLFQNQKAMEAFRGSELFAAVAATPSFVNITARDFAVLEGPTRATRGAVRVPAGAAAP